jgi:hypothetical protein
MLSEIRPQREKSFYVALFLSQEPPGLLKDGLHISVPFRHADTLATYTPCDHVMPRISLAKRSAEL